MDPLAPFPPTEPTHMWRGWFGTCFVIACAYGALIALSYGNIALFAILGIVAFGLVMGSLED